MSIPRSEYPRPQFVRTDWLCLNGPWQFEIDRGDTGLDRGLCEAELAGEITVPFCPESALSGIGDTDFMPAVWYRREVVIPGAWVGRDVLLHFQAVDYDATVWVNGQEVARHRGGFSPFTAELTGVAAPGEKAVIVVRARDYIQNRAQPGGKQCTVYANRGCHYTRTTGIWQTVWMEPVPTVRLKRPRITPDVAAGMIRLVQPITNSRAGTNVRATLSDATGQVASVTVAADSDFSPQLDLAIPGDRRVLWSPEDPHLYDLHIELLDAAGAVIDGADSYAGLRSVTIDGMAVKINGKTVFQRLVLDQGYYADGIMTAPTEQAMIADIELAMAAGFNGARLHQKVFEERFLYHADRLGYLVWGEFGDWGFRVRAAAGGALQTGYHYHQPGAALIAQWTEVLHRDYSHPSIVGWCPLNETAQPIEDQITSLDDVTVAMYLATKAMDATRPVLDASGYSHRIRDVDIYDSHCYEQDPAVLAEEMAPLAGGDPYSNDKNRPADKFVSTPYGGQPYFVSEFGGIWWNPAAVADGKDASWGYGDRPTSIEEFYARFEGLCNVLLDDVNMFGYCYTQLTDVFQEQNGIYFFDRSEKFDTTRIRDIQQRAAAIESPSE